MFGGAQKANQRQNKLLHRHNRSAEEFTTRPEDIYVKHQVTTDRADDKMVCWDCMHIREALSIHDATTHPGHDKLVINGEAVIAVSGDISVNTGRDCTAGMYRFNNRQVCKASGHKCMAFSAANAEDFRNLKDWGTEAREDEAFKVGLPTDQTEVFPESNRSEKLNSVEAQMQFLNNTLNLFPAMASPLAYPEGGMPEYGGIPSV